MTPSTGETIHDPIHRAAFRFEAEDDNLWVLTWLEPGGHPPEHFHPTLEERWGGARGHGGREGRRPLERPDRRGRPAVVARGVRHDLRNTSKTVAHLRTKVTPAGRLREFLTKR